MGSLEVAWTPERLEDLKRKVGLAKTWGIEAEVIDTEESIRRLPFLSDRILGSMWTPTDGLAKAPKACEAMSPRVPEERRELPRAHDGHGHRG